VNVSIKLVQRIREEFEEAPALRLTIGEGARFWGLDERTCEQVLAELLATGVVVKSLDDGRFGLSHQAGSRFRAAS
jgi:hypothetical protein